MTERGRRITLDPRDWNPAELAATLAIASGAWTSCTSTVWLDPAKVLATPWNPGRLERCRLRLAAGDEAPTIKVTGYRIGGIVLYGVSDGHHRATAAGEAGRKIKARIRGHQTIDVRRRTIAHGWLWDLGDGAKEAQAIITVDEVWRERLARIGIADLDRV